MPTPSDITATDPTAAATPGRLLDVTRLVRRIGRPVLTGIDRVELAWLDHLLARPDPLWLLVGGRRRQLLLPRAAGALIRGWLNAPPQPKGFVEQAIAGRRGIAAVARRRLARQAVASAGPGNIARAVAARMPAGGWYLNLGHLNAEAPRLAGLGRVPGLKRALMLHDAIPLDHPEWSEPHAVSQVAALIAAANRQSERVIAISGATRDALHRHGLTRTTRVVPLGVATAVPDRARLPDALDRDRPWFVVLGTVEPRKDHEMLLDLWESLRADPPPGGLPQLLVIGRRGWQSDALLERLAAAAADPATGVIHCEALDDAGTAAAMAEAVALLMPSRAEGFGLPVFEAVALGCPVIAAPLPAYREILGDSVVYAPAGDLYAWRSEVVRALEQAAAASERRAAGPVPDWAAHFNAVLADLA
ncbi:glycosyltransferase [Frigidibacter sp. MR17.24]|uniref:glycosyltransferase n=1 Tax=Frigidibacter sp. MR17.24 TaxID=3127345 RepID=UPI003012DC2C